MGNYSKYNPQKNGVTKEKISKLKDLLKSEDLSDSFRYKIKCKLNQCEKISKSL